MHFLKEMKRNGLKQHPYGEQVYATFLKEFITQHFPKPDGRKFLTTKALINFTIFKVNFRRINVAINAKTILRSCLKVNMSSKTPEFIASVRINENLSVKEHTCSGQNTLSI